MLSYHQSNGGAAIACNRLVKALRDNGEEVHHLVQEGSKKNGIELTTKNLCDKAFNFIRFVFERLYFLSFEKNKSIRFLFNPGLFGKNISQHPAIQSADIIHIHFTNFGFLSIKNIAQLCALGKPVIWTLHDMWAFTGGCHHSGACENYQLNCGNCTEFIKYSHPNDLSHQLWSKKIKAFQQKNLSIITCSKWLQARAQKSSILKNQKIIALPNTLNSEQIFVPQHKNTAKQKLGLPENIPLLLFVAVRPNAPKKGFKQFIEAVQILENRTSFQIGIVGKIIDKAPFDQIKQTIHYFGHIHSSEQLAQIYQASDCYVTTSLEENLPNTIMEAMSCGTPCIGFEVGGIPEMITHQINGYVAKSFDTHDFANGIQWVLEQDEQLGKNARNKVESEYSEKLVAQQHLNFYQDCLRHV